MPCVISAKDTWTFYKQAKSERHYFINTPTSLHCSTKQMAVTATSIGTKCSAGLKSIYHRLALPVSLEVP